ncbi:unnamed protein product, partial [Rotaria sp. Silwood2]
MAYPVAHSMLTIPANLVHRILDHLDDFTILCSVRNVCTGLNVITEAYHRFA